MAGVRISCDLCRCLGLWWLRQLLGAGDWQVSFQKCLGKAELIAEGIKRGHREEDMEDMWGIQSGGKKDVQWRVLSWGQQGQGGCYPMKDAEHVFYMHKHDDWYAQWGRKGLCIGERSPSDAKDCHVQRGIRDQRADNQLWAVPFCLGSNGTDNPISFKVFERPWRSCTTHSAALMASGLLDSCSGQLGCWNGSRAGKLCIFVHLPCLNRINHPPCCPCMLNLWAALE